VKELKGNKLRELEEALVSAFPTRTALERMLKHRLDEELDQIVGNSNLTDIVFELIKWAQAHGRIDELLHGAIQENPDNSELKKFSSWYLEEEKRTSPQPDKPLTKNRIDSVPSHEIEKTPPFNEGAFMTSRAYINFDLQIEPSSDVFRAHVLQSGAGTGSVEFDLPFSPLELENFVLKMGHARRGGTRLGRGLDSPELKAAKDFGSKLFGAVFQGDVYARLLASLEQAQTQEQGLRILLRLPPELNNLPWEYLYKLDTNQFFSLSVETPLVRYFELNPAIRPLPVRPPLRLLVVISSPSDYRALDVDREWNELQTTLQPLVERGALQIERLESASLLALQRKLRQGRYHIFHFIGHGIFDESKQDGVLIFSDEHGRGSPQSGQDLGTLLRDHRSLRLALLNTCEGARTGTEDPFAGVAHSLVQMGLPAVIAMQFEISDSASILFAQEFYTALADGHGVDAALGEARKAIFARQKSVEWGTPVLFSRTGDGRVFELGVVAAPQPVIQQPLSVNSNIGEAKPPPVSIPVLEREAQVSKTPVRLPFEPEMVRIPAGEFWMGSTEHGDEQPQHKVLLAEYAIGKYPITCREYQAFVQDSKQTAPKSWSGDQYPVGKADHPVVNISWDNAQAYCVWLSQKTGKQYCLPSEAEWEKAARGVDRRVYPWGDQFGPERANILDANVGDTTIVGRFSPQGNSPYGCVDMVGNVWEWTRSLYKPYPYDAQDGREDLQSRSSRVLRGAAFYHNRRTARCAYRNPNDLYVTPDDFGFRVCLVSPIFTSDP
jgi:formylglycine-generating enzyme required for sulfatase activity